MPRYEDYMQILDSPEADEFIPGQEEFEGVRLSLGDDDDWEDDLAERRWQDG